MSANVSFNPFVTTNAAGLFGVQSDGFYQGMALDDPAVRFQLAGGPLASTEALPMWGGVGISEAIPSATQLTNGLGGNITRAAGLSTLTGFSVFNQATNGVVTTSNNVPVLANGQTVVFYRFGSNARIAVAVDPTLISADGSIVTTQFSWDYTNQMLIAYTSSGANAGAVPVKAVLGIQPTNCKTVTYNSGTGFANFNNNGACALILI